LPSVAVCSLSSRVALCGGGRGPRAPRSCCLGIFIAPCRPTRSAVLCASTMVIGSMTRTRQQECTDHGARWAAHRPQPSQTDQTRCTFQSSNWRVRMVSGTPIVYDLVFDHIPYFLLCNSAFRIHHFETNTRVIVSFFVVILESDELVALTDAFVVSGLGVAGLQQRLRSLQPVLTGPNCNW